MYRQKISFDKYSEFENTWSIVYENLVWLKRELIRSCFEQSKNVSALIFMISYSSHESHINDFAHFYAVGNYKKHTGRFMLFHVL